eukprot:11585239-Karenia_brevis.AAC.1
MLPMGNGSTEYSTKRKSIGWPEAGLDEPREPSPCPPARQIKVCTMGTPVSWGQSSMVVGGSLGSKRARTT